MFEDVARLAEKAAGETKDVGDRVRALFPDPSPGVLDLMATAAGTSFEGGIYRLLALDEVESFVAACESLVPESAGAVRCFGCDWLGRPWGYSMDEEGEVFVIEPYSGEMLVTTATVQTLHRETFGAVGDQRALDSPRLRAEHCSGSVPRPPGSRSDRLTSAIKPSASSTLPSKPAPRPPPRNVSLSCSSVFAAPG